MSKATIQKILKLEPIPGADRIEKATVLGWEVVVAKGLYKVDDTIVYVEIDSILPKKDEYAFIKSTRKLEDGSEWFYVRSIKLRGQISQGLILPVITLPLGVPLTIGADVSEILNIKHYEKPVPAQLAGEVKGHFPKFLSKTDEPRMQSVPELLEHLKGNPFYISTKYDGTSATFYKFNGEFGACSRNLELKENPDNAFWKLANKYNLKEILPEGVCIQGELVGPGIQKNPMQLKELDFYIFNAYEITGRKFYNLEKLLDFCMNNNLKAVNVEETGESFDYTQEFLLEKAKGCYVGTSNYKEGIVVRSAGMAISFKVLNNDFLISEEA